MLRYSPTRRRRRHFVLLGFFAVLAILIIKFYSTNISQRPSSPLHVQSATERAFNPLLSQHARVWRSLHGLIINNHPRCNKKPDPVVPRRPVQRYDSESDAPRPDVLWIDDEDVQRMKTAHSNFVADIKALADGPVFKAGTKGIVTTASESLLAILSISLRMLRKTDSNLHVEIFLNRPSPYTETFCTQVFPQLNAACRYLSDIFEAAETSVKLNTYQYKIFAILFSSFEDVLFLDSDAWPVTNPEPLFHSLPFSDLGLVLWPDFWFASESPYFFEIAKIKDVPLLNARASTESGEILYSKSKHGLSIMLATYYNFYGPDYYYILQSQGSPGQGDKETFPWAAAALNEPFYAVKHPVGTLGRHDTNGEYIGTAMIQHDPVQDFFSSPGSKDSSSSSRLNRNPIKDPAAIAHPEISNDNPNNLPEPQIDAYSSYSSATAPKPLFVHANFPKFDPYTIFNADVQNGIHTPTRDSNGSAVRCWMPRDDALAAFGVDIEARFWTAMEEAACGELLGLWLGGGRPGRAELDAVRKRDALVCERVRKYRKEVFGVG